MLLKIRKVPILHHAPGEIEPVAPDCDRPIKGRTGGVKAGGANGSHGSTIEAVTTPERVGEMAHR